MVDAKWRGTEINGGDVKSKLGEERNLRSDQLVNYVNLVFDTSS